MIQRRKSSLIRSYENHKDDRNYKVDGVLTMG